MNSYQDNANDGLIKETYLTNITSLDQSLKFDTSGAPGCFIDLPSLRFIDIISIIQTT